jgi:diguanylate cyclase (GGDEF)-like protein/PAS domain S-box-containing protein
MHSLLKRQLKKLNYNGGAMSEDELNRFIESVNQAYIDNDTDLKLLENSLELTSKEMRELYKKLKIQSDSKLAQSEKKYRTIINNLHGYYFFYSHDTDGVFNFLSDSITEILGYTKDEFMTHYSRYFTDESINQEAVKYTDLSIKGIQQDPYIVGIYHKDRSVRYLEVIETPLFDENGTVISIEGIAKDVTKEYLLNQEVSHIAKHDTLTGISNRLHLDEMMEVLISTSKKRDREFAFLFLDLDHFKEINDTYGHNVGDLLLQEITTVLQKQIRSEDIFARIGGDEFIIVLTNIKRERLSAPLEMMIKTMRQTWDIQGQKLKVSASIGVSLYPKDAQTTQDLMKCADIAMYKAKKLGRDNYSFF